MNLTLAPGILEKVIEEAQKASPKEACGLLVGRGAGDRFVPIKNISADPHQYEMDPAELIAAFRNLRETGELLIAIVHSHPNGPAEPSKTDVERAYYPQAAHLIVSLADAESPRAVAFRIVDGEILPVEVHVIV
jgi:[CysO sulfur-carrier protein]-S-L-cysteine hydrolase